MFMHALKNTNNWEVYDSGKFKSSIFTIVGMLCENDMPTKLKR